MSRREIRDSAFKLVFEQLLRDDDIQELYDIADEIDEIIVNDEVKKIVDVYNAVDLFVLPSLEDNLPNTIVEALACGTPCVGFHVGGIPEMIDHQQNGYVARYRDVEDFAHGILYCLDPQRRQQLAEAARQKALATYSEEHVAQLYTAVYEAEPQH